MNISLVQGSTTLVLNGTGAAVPLRAGKIDLSAPGLAVIECALDGTAAQIASFQQSAEKILMLGGLYASLPGEDWAYVWVTLPDGSVWRSPVLGSKTAAAPGPGSRGGGSQGFKLWLEIALWWESTTLTDVALSNHWGTLQTGGLQVDNHQDAGHDDYVNIAASTILGDVPAPAVLTLSSSVNGLEYLVGQCVTNGVAAFTGMLEGESISVGVGGITVTPTADAACSSGNYAACGWNGAGVVGGGWGVDPTSYAARVYRPVLRLRNFVAGGEKILLWVRLTGPAGDILLDAEGVIMPTDRKLVVLPPVALPPWSKPPAGFSWEGLTPWMVVQAEGAGAHVLNVDFFQMLPTEGWLRFYCVQPLMTYSQVRYDCGSGQNTRSATAGVTHVPEGPGIWLYPGVQQKIFVLNQNAADSAIGTNTTVRVQYRARKRVL